MKKKTFRELHRRQVDFDLEEFLLGGQFKFDSFSFLDMEDLKQEYFHYRYQNGLDKIRWTYDVYAPIFSVYGIVVTLKKGQIRDAMLWGICFKQ